MDNLYMSIDSIPKYLSKYLFNKEVKHFILDPLTCIIRCAILSFKPKGTKISIYENKISFCDPNFLQGTLRWGSGDKREDLHNIYNPIIKSTQWYSKDDKNIINIFSLAKRGLQKLKTSYEENSIIAHSLALYINIIDLFINSEQKCVNELFDSKKKELKNIENENDNIIYKELKNLWDENQISIVNNILIQVQNDKNNSKEWLEALNIILLSKEKCVNEIVIKNTTQLK
jgi:hypothetical protein|uniref:Uncharacterized protein n=1 Tax=Mimiviridae sp. ChoanoV1 TaxID=2596887 RepID=A0A5B8HXD3_9VIRU|nr:hypothetical protein 1_255 [Mimiviridae sp. ChoanoV1]